MADVIGPASVVTGGGTLTSAGSKAAAAAAVVTDGGTLTSDTGRKGGRSTSVLTGGGALTSETGRKASSGSAVVLFGGGTLTSIVAKGPVRVPPRPVPPVAAPALPNPTSAPTVTPQAGGTLPAGTYRYAYAGWRLSRTLCTAPSPVAEVVLATGQGSVAISYVDVPGADGHLIYRQAPGETRLYPVEV